MYVIIVHTYLQNCKANAVNVLPSIGKPLLWNIQDQTESRKIYLYRNKDNLLILQQN